MVRKGFALLIVLLSLAIILAFTITLPEQADEPTATIEVFKLPATNTYEAYITAYAETAVRDGDLKTATAIIAEVTELAPTYHLSQTARVETLEPFFPTFTAVANTQVHVAATYTASADSITATPIPIFETAIQIDNEVGEGTQSPCRSSILPIDVTIDASIQQNIHDELSLLETPVNVSFEAASFKLVPNREGAPCGYETYAELSIQLSSQDLSEDELPTAIDRAMSVLDRHLSGGYEAVFPSPRLIMSFRVFHHVFFDYELDLETDYHRAMSLFRSGLRGEDLIAALGGFYPSIRIYP